MKKNREKGEIFTVLGAKNHFGKGGPGEGKNITFWARYTPLNV